MKHLKIALSFGLVAATTVALALPQYIAVCQKTYKIPAGSALAKANCAACHIGHGPKLNPYGEDLKKAMAGSKELTPAMLHKIDALDSDKDGAKNIVEIKAGTLPGDAKSKPAAAKKPAPKKPAAKKPAARK